MGWFSPIKGSYPSLGQIDKTLPVDAASTAIERGMIIEVTGNDTFKIAAVNNATYKEPMLYIALQDYKDAQAGMAGTTGFDATVASTTNVPDTMRPTAGVPSITGLALAMEGEYETSLFDSSITSSTPIGTGLSVKDGRFFVATDDSDSSNDSAPVVAYLTGKPAERWVNNATAKSQGAQVVRQGKSVPVIRFRTK